MKILRFSYRKRQYYGILEGTWIRPVSGTVFGSYAVGKKKIPLKDIRTLPPCEPSKIVLAGLNYRDHAAELNMPVPAEPVIFLKPPTALIGHRDAVRYHRGIKRLDYEAELALVIKKTCRCVSARAAARYILGYTCLNDVTARDIQKRDGQWTRAKSFDTFCPVGPWIETSIRPHNLRIRAIVNGEVRQDSTTAQFIFSVGYLVSFVSRVMTLLPGDIISTGTPPGVGSLRVGDTVEVDIEGIGRLTNTVKN